MTGEVGVREAVRQLGRAVGTLLRAVVRAVRRPRPVVQAPEQDGPPQAWLDLVAETDPDWLARSRWAGRPVTPRDEAVRPVRTHLTPVEPRAVTPTAVPDDLDDERSGPEPAPSLAETAPHPAPPSPRRGDPARSVPRLVPVAPDTPVAAQPTRRPLSEPVPPSGPDPRNDPYGSLAEVERTPRERLSWPDPVTPEPHHRDDSAAPPERARPTSSSPLTDRVTELPGTWRQPPTGALRQPPVRDVAPTATAPSWPALPATDLDDDAPGLTARLWGATHPDDLTTAQRRS